MIVHVCNDDSQSYQYEVGDWVKLNCDLYCLNSSKNGVRVNKGAYGKVSDNYWGSSTDWAIRTIRVELWNTEFKCFMGCLVEHVWHFSPLQDICVVRNVEY